MSDASTSAKTDYSKLVAGIQGGGTGATIATIVIWILDMKGVQVPPEIAVALASLFTAALGALGTWLKRETAVKAPAQ